MFLFRKRAKMPFKKSKVDHEWICRVLFIVFIELYLLPFFLSSLNEI